LPSRVCAVVMVRWTTGRRSERKGA
jgi:hypothetical protein